MTNPINKYQTANQLAKSSDPLLSDLTELIEQTDTTTARATVIQETGTQYQQPTNAIFAFDTTSSMNPCINAVKNNLTEITNNLLRENPVPIMIAGVGEYSDPQTLQIRDFTTNPEKLRQNIKSINCGGGGGACQVSLELLWQELNNHYIQPTQKYVMIITSDEIAHGQDNLERRPRADYRHELNRLRPYLAGFYFVSCTPNSRSTEIQRIIDLQKQLINPTSDTERHILLENMDDLKYILPPLLVAAVKETEQRGTGIQYLETKLTLPGTTPKEIEGARQVRGFLT
jgi:hypothetical protein